MAKRQCFLLAQDGSFVAQQGSNTWWILLQEVDVANDQVEISIAKTVVNERNQLPVTANIRTRSTAVAAVPTTVEYKLYNLSTGEQVRGWTSLSAAAQVSFTISAVDNKILDDAHVMERIALMVSADRGLSTEAVGRTQYKIRNLAGHE